ncbi:MAG: hypothetical protein WA364_28635 [Candidatus Nitrosopolaris sp.]
MVITFDLFIPIPKERKNKIIDDASNAIPRSAAFIGKKPRFPCPTTASAMYIRISATYGNNYWPGNELKKIEAKE